MSHGSERNPLEEHATAMQGMDEVHAAALARDNHETAAARARASMELIKRAAADPLELPYRGLNEAGYKADRDARARGYANPDGNGFTQLTRDQIVSRHAAQAFVDAFHGPSNNQHAQAERAVYRLDHEAKQHLKLADEDEQRNRNLS